MRYRPIVVLLAGLALVGAYLTGPLAAATSPATPPSALLSALGAHSAQVVPLSRVTGEVGDGHAAMLVTDLTDNWVALVTRTGQIQAARFGTGVTSSGSAIASVVSPTPVAGLVALAGTRNVPVTTVDGGASSGGSSPLVGVLGFVGGMLLLMLGLAAISRFRGGQGAGGGMSSIAGHNRIRSSSKVAPSSVHFDDVAGADEAVDELRETVAFLTEPERFASAGARMPRGVILYGPPGTGKTMLASAVSGEAGVPYYSLSGSEFVESLVGVGAARVRDLFAKARKSKTGAVIFIDEIDAVGRRRGGAGGGGNDERESTLNQLLVELDGFAARDRIVVIAATNRLELLDEALTRPGRFDRHIQVGLPAERGRRAILSVHARDKQLADAGDLDHIAAVTAGFSGADLAKLLNEAAIMAARDGRSAIDAEDLAEGMLRAVAGPEKKDRALAAGELERIAWHEAGHALAAELSPTHPVVQRMTILARGQAAGLALYGDTDTAMHSPQAVHERIVVALAGRAAEQLRFGTISSGAANDLEQANRLARTAVERLGFAPQVGQLVSSVSEQPLQLSEHTRRLMDAAVREMVDAAYTDALAMLGAHRAELDALADAVLTHEQLDRAALHALLWGVSDPGATRPTTVHALPTDRRPAEVDVPAAVPEPSTPAMPTPGTRLAPRRRRSPVPALVTGVAAAAAAAGPLVGRIAGLTGRRRKVAV